MCLGFLFRDSMLNVGRERGVPTATQTPLRAQRFEVPAGVPEQRRCPCSQAARKETRLLVPCSLEQAALRARGGFMPTTASVHRVFHVGQTPHLFTFRLPGFQTREPHGSWSSLYCADTRSFWKYPPTPSSCTNPMGTCFLSHMWCWTNRASGRASGSTVGRAREPQMGPGLCWPQ